MLVHIPSGSVERGDDQRAHQRLPVARSRGSGGLTPLELAGLDEVQFLHSALLTAGIWSLTTHASRVVDSR